MPSSCRFEASQPVRRREGSALVSGPRGHSIWKYSEIVGRHDLQPVGVTVALKLFGRNANQERAHLRAGALITPALDAHGLLIGHAELDALLGIRVLRTGHHTRKAVRAQIRQGKESAAQPVVELGDDRCRCVQNLQCVVVDVGCTVQRSLKIDAPGVLHAIDATRTTAANQGEALEGVVVLVLVLANAFAALTPVAVCEAIVSAGSAERRRATDRGASALDALRFTRAVSDALERGGLGEHALPIGPTRRTVRDASATVRESARRGALLLCTRVRGHTALAADTHLLADTSTAALAVAIDADGADALVVDAGHARVEAFATKDSLFLAAAPSRHEPTFGSIADPLRRIARYIVERNK